MTSDKTLFKVILELEPGAAEQPDSRGKNYLHTAIIKVEQFVKYQLKHHCTIEYIRDQPEHHSLAPAERP